MRKIVNILFLLLVGFSFAQGGMKEKKEKIKALKVAYITEQLDLTTEEAQKFWPVYNAFDDKQFELKHNKMKTIVNKFEAGGIDQLSEKEALELITKMDAYEDEMHQLKKKFLKDLLNVLPPKKVIKLKKAEDEFNRKLLREFRGRKN